MPRHNNSTYSLWKRSGEIQSTCSIENSAWYTGKLMLTAGIVEINLWIVVASCGTRELRDRRVYIWDQWLRNPVELVAVGIDFNGFREESKGRRFGETKWLLQQKDQDAEMQADWRIPSCLIKANRPIWSKWDIYKRTNEMKWRDRSSLHIMMLAEWKALFILSCQKLSRGSQVTFSLHNEVQRT